MVSLLFSITASIFLSSLFRTLQAVPLAEKLRRLSPPARDLLKRSTPAAPHFLAYNDQWLNPLPALTFLLASGSVDEAQNWQELTASQRSSYLSEYSAAGISLIVSAFGSTETPTSSGYNAVMTANTMAAWVTEYGVNGIDVDYEVKSLRDFTAFNSGGGDAETWLISFTQQLRAQLPQGEYILTHAREFSPSMWTGGGYLAVDQSVGSMIDWYNVQFYNQGATEYTTCAGLLTTSSSAWPETALFQIAANGVSLDKLAIDAGVMVWQYPDVTSSWIETVRGSTWPVSGTPALATTTAPMTTAPTGTTTTTSSGESCSGVAAWANNVAYTSGEQVTYGGDLWTANQWNQAETPGGSSGAWTLDGAC
ncbi:glycoside hydrolase family 18 protein [Chiua virens]|nr:glycoside hydrolase family 18 protein [Chiua virens]